MSTPSLQSVSTLISMERPVVPMSNQEFMRYLLRQRGAKCGQCHHNLVLDHDHGRCQVCGCIRVRKNIQKGMALSELFDMDNLADRKQNYVAPNCPDCKSEHVYRKGFEQRPIAGPRALWQCRDCGKRWRDAQ